MAEDIRREPYRNMQSPANHTQGLVVLPQQPFVLGMALRLSYPWEKVRRTVLVFVQNPFHAGRQPDTDGNPCFLTMISQHIPDDILFLQMQRVYKRHSTRHETKQSQIGCPLQVSLLLAPLHTRQKLHPMQGDSPFARIFPPQLQSGEGLLRRGNQVIPKSRVIDSPEATHIAVYRIDTQSGTLQIIAEIQHHRAGNLVHPIGLVS